METWCNLHLLRVVPQKQEVAWASGPPPEIQTADCVLLRDGSLACPLLVRYAAANVRDPGHGSARRQSSSRIKLLHFPTLPEEASSSNIAHLR